MSRLVDADVVKAKVKNWLKTPTDFRSITKIIDSTPTVEAIPVVHGEWIPKPVMVRSPHVRKWYCSECRYEPLELTEYCPCCLAKNKKEKTDG